MKKKEKKMSIIGVDDKVEKPRIISILTLDRLDLTKKAVESVFKNSVENIRIVFLDNGSKDGTIEYLDELIKIHSNVSVIKSDVNLGVAAGRNRIFKYIISKYGDDGFEWVLSLDNDCILHEGYDVALTKCFKETGAASVCPRLIQPNGRIFHNAHNGFMINLEDMKLRLEYAENVNILYDDPIVSKRIETDVILGTSAKSPEFFKQVGFLDEGHKIGWEDFAIALKAFGVKGNTFLEWSKENRHKGKKWTSLRSLAGNNKSKTKVIYEPGCMITHNHPVNKKYESYEKIRWKSKTIAESTAHFKKVWGVEPVF